MRWRRWGCGLLSLGASVLLVLVLLTSPWVMRMGTAAAWPGEERHDLEALDPRFRACLERALERLRAQGHVPVVRATWRDAERQRFYVGEGASQTMNSLHRLSDASGRPAALAADIGALAPLVLVPWHALFYHRLLAAAEAEGLTTGARWRRSSRVWTHFGLGWDPAHVEPRRGTGCGR